jgi:hypothetical protein
MSKWVTFNRWSTEEDEMKALKLICTVGMQICLVASIATGAAWDNAGSIAMAGSYTAVAKGYNAVGFNPANLALTEYKTSSFQLFGFGTLLKNNAFTLGDYNNYNGTHLSDSDKRDILNKIPSEGLEFRGNSSASALSFSAGPLALSTSVEASGSGNISKDVVELALFGNKIDETVSLSDADAEGIVHADVNIAYGRKVSEFEWGELTAGATFRYIRGLAYFEVTEARGTATTATSGINGDGRVVVRSALGGSGYGIDLGLAAKYLNDWTFSVAARNIVSQITWNSETQENEYYYEIISLTAESADEDSTVVSDEIERPIGSFKTSLAPQLNFGAAHAIGNFLIASDLKFGLADKAGATTTPELSIGGEYQGVEFLPLRAGLAFGGLHGFSLGLGGGLALGAFSLDLAWASSGTVLPKVSKGAAFAITTGFMF